MKRNANLLLSRQKRELKTLQRQRDQALRLMRSTSHDLRNSLSVIFLATELLRLQREEPDAVSDCVKKIRQALVQADGIISALLDYSRLQLNEPLTIWPRPTELDSILRQALVKLNHEAPERKVKLTMLGDFKGQWDNDRLLQVFHALLDNANRYAPVEDSLEVSLDARTDQIKLDIVNPHPVIPAEKLMSLFQPLPGDSHPSAGKGMGLSLYIVRQLISAHQGSISITSADGSGTRVSVSLPRFATSHAGFTQPFD